MARPNKRIRAKLKTLAQVQLVATLRNEHDDSKLLQRGPVRSSVERFNSTRPDKFGNVFGNSLHTRAPRPLYDGPTKGTPTKVQSRPPAMPDFEAKPQIGIIGRSR